MPTCNQLYRVVACPSWEYLTVDVVYRADYIGRATVGLHRPDTGAGTYVARRLIENGQIVLEPVNA